MEKKIFLATPRGFCAGVERAVQIIEKSLAIFGPPVYCRKEIVHNRFVVDAFIQQGVIFVDNLSQVPPRSIVIFSAHGVSPAIWNEAKENNLQVIDATCPLVTKVHLEVRHYVKKGYTIVMIGHQNHDEVVGIVGEAPESVSLVENTAAAEAIQLPSDKPIAVVTQTTLSLEDTKDIFSVLQQRFPGLITPNKSDICYATQNRQSAVKELAKRVELVMVIGSPNSSNSNRLVEVARSTGVTSFLINHIDEIDREWFKTFSRIGVTAGASTPELVVNEIISFIRENGFGSIETMQGIEENMIFSLPTELQDKPLPTPV